MPYFQSDLSVRWSYVLDVSSSSMCDTSELAYHVRGEAKQGPEHGVIIGTHCFDQKSSVNDECL